MRFPTFKSRLAFVALWPLVRVREWALALRRAFRLGLLRHRVNLIGSRGLHHSAQPPEERLLAVITHVAPGDPHEAARRLAYLRTCIDCVVRSFAHLAPRLVVNTYVGRHVVSSLPMYQRALCEILEHATGDPMMIEFAVQDVFIQYRDEFQWFLFLEDDVAVHDSAFVDKLREFNLRAGLRGALLLPHRYELHEGRKAYIDRDPGNSQWSPSGGSTIEDVTNPATLISYETGYGGRLSFAEFTNPHAACYCLSREQLDRWAATGRRWQGKVTWIGPLESAATGCLFEAFDLYKPVPSMKRFLEVEHLDPKYAERYRRVGTTSASDAAHAQQSAADEAGDG